MKARILRYEWVGWLAAKPGFGALLDPAWRSNRTAAQALSLLGSSAKDAVPELIKTLEANPDEESRRCAAVCLRLIGLDAAEAVPALTRASILDSTFVRSDAREALCCMGAARTNGLALALEHEFSRDETIRTAAQVTLNVVDPGRVYGKGHIAERNQLATAPDDSRIPRASRHR